MLGRRLSLGSGDSLVVSLPRRQLADDLLDGEGDGLRRALRVAEKEGLEYVAFTPLRRPCIAEIQKIRKEKIEEVTREYYHFI